MNNQETEASLSTQNIERRYTNIQNKQKQQRKVIKMNIEPTRKKRTWNQVLA